MPVADGERNLHLQVKGLAVRQNISSRNQSHVCQSHKHMIFCKGSSPMSANCRQVQYICVLHYLKVWTILINEFCHVTNTIIQCSGGWQVLFSPLLSPAAPVTDVFFSSFISS